MHFRGIERTEVVGFAERVVAGRREAQMGGVHAAPRLTRVVNDAPLRNRAERVVIRDSVRLPVFETKQKAPVAVAVFVPGPNETLATRLSFGLEAGPFCGGE